MPNTIMSFLDIQEYDLTTMVLSYVELSYVELNWGETHNHSRKSQDNSSMYNNFEVVLNKFTTKTMIKHQCT